MRPRQDPAFPTRLYRVLLPLLAALALALIGATASAQEAAITSVRMWSPPAAQDHLAAAQAALESAPASSPDGAGAGFRLAPGRPAWYAIAINDSAAAEPLVLELTHPSIRSATLYVPLGTGGAPTVLQGGRAAAPETRAASRLPATFQLPPAAAGPRVVYLRVENAVPVRGRFLLQPRPQWAEVTGRTRVVQAISLGLMVLASLYAAVQAVRMRSVAWMLFALMCGTAAAARVFISGYAENWLWPALAALRGPLSTSLAGCAAGFTLLLFRSAFMLEVRAPAYSRWLLVTALACPVAGFAGLLFELAVQQRLTQVVATIAIVMGLTSIFLAWRTSNRVAMWMLGGFLPVAIGAAIMTLATAGVFAFEPWMLLAVPLASMVEIPMNVRGLYLLERRRRAVLEHRARVAEGAGPTGETRPAMAARLMKACATTRHAPATLMLLRFEGLAPGSATLREMDAVNVERYLNSMLEFAVHAGNLTGRWSFNELPLLRIHLQATSGVSGLLTALFAQGLRSDSFELRPRDVALRIAYGRFDGREIPVADALSRLAAALDDPRHASQRRIELDLKFRKVIPPAPRASAFPSPG